MEEEEEEEEKFHKWTVEEFPVDSTEFAWH